MVHKDAEGGTASKCSWRLHDQYPLTKHSDDEGSLDSSKLIAGVTPVCPHVSGIGEWDPQNGTNRNRSLTATGPRRDGPGVVGLRCPSCRAV